jgi:hypothetical protein
MGPFRVERPQVKAAATPTAQEQFRSYLDRLMRMIPGEVVGLYLVGRGMIPADEPVSWLAGWTAVCFVALFAVRLYGTSDPQADKGPQWASVLISAVAYLIWVYTLGGPLVADFYKPFVGSLLVLAWTFFVPLFYKGD